MMEICDSICRIESDPTSLGVTQMKYILEVMSWNLAQVVLWTY